MNNPSFLTILLFPYIISVLIMLVLLILKRTPETSYNFFVSLFIPIIGTLYVIFSRLFSILSRDSETILESYEKYIKGNVYKWKRKKPSTENEINLVPMEDALIVNENKIKRSLVINILKKDPTKHIDVIKKALEDEDTETTHYAATAILQIKNSFNIMIQEYSVKYESDKENLNITIPYYNILKKYVDSGLLDEQNVFKYRVLISELLTSILNRYTKYDKYYIDKIDNELELNNFYIAEKYCEDFFNNYPNTEKPYLMYLKTYFKLGDKKTFNKYLKALMDSPIQLSNEGLNIVRFWTREEKK
ncbi:hypothetical protein SH2C18_38180 [Clostridium sediminicola]|uniref:hypothetical protein n=1 Tax=Clostridium sediminicola TaxID=3114879 RepID=UPI0031F1E6B6